MLLVHFSLLWEAAIWQEITNQLFGIYLQLNLAIGVEDCHKKSWAL